jgi:opacity protein-like surface antigen
MKKLVLCSAIVAAAAMASPAQANYWTDNVYVEVLGGPTFYPHLTFNGVPVQVDDGFNAGGRVGYRLDDELPFDGLAVEFDGLYNQAHYTGTQSRMSSGSLMANLVYRFDSGMGFGVYGGGGLGAVQTSFNGHGFEGSSTVLGWQALGGLDAPLDQNTSLFAEYRYQNAHAVNFPFATHVGNTSNSFSVGLKFNL